MFTSVVLTMVTDITDHSQRLVQKWGSSTIVLIICRAKLFFFLGLADSISQITAPLLEAWMMAINLWLSFAISVIIYFAISALIWSIPDMKNYNIGLQQDPPRSDSEAPLISESPRQSLEYGRLEEAPVPKAAAYGSQPWKETMELVMSRNSFIMLFCFFLKRLGFTSDAFFPQYASERFHLVLRQTPWFKWTQALGSTLMLGIVLPSVTVFTRRRGIAPRSTDLIIISCSLLVLITAYFMISQASAVGVFGAGESVSVLIGGAEVY